MAENLDKLWCELRKHSTIERDPQKLSQLASELEKRKGSIATLYKRDEV
jgi:hypothetical protein